MMNMEKNAGYDITEKLTVGNSIFVLGRKDSQYGTKYVTWAARQDDPTNYFWGYPHKNKIQTVFDMSRNAESYHNKRFG